MPKLKPPQTKKPVSKCLWLGPESDDPKGGITQGMINRWLGCKERFRLEMIEGLTPNRGFDKTIEYGHMWHTCEEYYLKTNSVSKSLEALTEYAKSIARQYPLQQEEVEKWYQVCKLQFPIYVDYWKKHPATVKSLSISREEVFKVPYNLPSGRTVYLRGKFDGVDQVGNSLVLRENKTKGDIRTQLLQRQLTFDLQTMVYLVALIQRHPGKKVNGILYNVVRRPLSGGRGTIVRHEATKGSKCSKCKGVGRIGTDDSLGPKCPKCEGVGRINAKPAETHASYYARLSDIIKGDCNDADLERSQYWFARWSVTVAPGDISNFKSTFLTPVLETICDWYSSVSAAFDRGMKPHEAETVLNSVGNIVYSSVHWRHPYGTYNVLNEGGSTDLDEFLDTGSESGLNRDKVLFSELI